MKQASAERFEHIPIDQIILNPLNPRKFVEDAEFAELVKSVARKGVLVPVLVRPGEFFPGTKLVGGLEHAFQLVYGERRYRAKLKAAEQNGGVEEATIPAIVRDLSDDDAFDAMTIENLQRKNLTPLEEAWSFKLYMERKGDGAAEELSERTGIHPRYIRRRVAILGLPKEVLKAWDNGEIQYGHCEHLARLKNKQDMLETFRSVKERRMSVRDLARFLTERAPVLAKAQFDKAKAGCASCHQNTSVQKQLFDLGEKGEERCLDTRCFKKHMNNHLQATWKKTGWYKQHHTSGFGFAEDYPEWTRLGSRERHSFRYTPTGKPPKSCVGCQNFVTILRLDGTADDPAACIGKQDCFDKSTKAAAAERTKKEKQKSTGGDGPRVAWHGNHFRQEFFRQQIPLRLQEVPAEDERMERLSLTALLHAERDIHKWFAGTFLGWDDEKIAKEERYSGLYLGDKEVFQAIRGMDPATVSRALKEATLQVLALPQFDGRHAVAAYLGTDIASEWAPTREYLDKKTVGEIHSWADLHGVWQTKEAQAYLFETLGKKRGKFTSCKKAELVQLILNCGLDLRGKLFTEIQAPDPQPDDEETTGPTMMEISEDGDLIEGEDE